MNNKILQSYFRKNMFGCRRLRQNKLHHLQRQVFSACHANKTFAIQLL